ncbi:hypothetical protein [Rubrivirga sp.]|uniref:hypothetical protein n=1 Tax=Rubrivirga sp. TaxID=1885344 RepID=UPI003C7685D2
MKRFPFHVLIAVAALALVVTAFTVPPAEPSAKTPHVRVIEAGAYVATITQKRSGATIVLEPVRGARPAWRAPLVSGGLMMARGNVCERAPDGYTHVEWTLFDFEMTGEQFGTPVYMGDAPNVALEDVAGFALQSEDGSSWIMVCDGMPMQNETGEDPPKEDPDGDEEPPADDDGGDEEPPEEGDGDGDGLCVGIVNPWTGECTPDVRDPWEGERSGEQIVLSI